MFQITKNKVRDFTIFRLSNPHSGAMVEIIPELGAMVNKLKLSPGQVEDFEAITIIEGCNPLIELPKNPGFKGALLFPFPNRINKGQYKFQGKSFQLEVNFPSQGHAIHGFIDKMAFNVEETGISESSAYINLSLDYQGDYKGFPFPFKMKLKYNLDIQGFSCHTEIENTGKSDMPMGEGWHPYFSFPNENIDELSLHLPGCSIMEVDNDMIPTGKMDAYRAFSFQEKIGNTEFDTGFYLTSGKERVQSRLTSAKFKAQIIVWQENYPFLQIYTPPGRATIAIEPMTSAADAFNNGIGLTVLCPNDFFNGSFGVELVKGQ